MNRSPRLLACYLLLLPAVLFSQKFDNQYLTFEVATGASLEFPFPALDDQYTVTGGDLGAIALTRLTDSLVQLTYHPEFGLHGQEEIRIEGVRVPGDPHPGLANYLLHIGVAEGAVKAQPDFAFLPYGKAEIVLDPLANDQGHLRALFLEAVTSRQGGRADFQAGGAQVVFRPDPEFSGLASFTYLACDAHGNCDQGTSSLWVEGPPGKALDTLRYFTMPGREVLLPVSPELSPLRPLDHGQLRVQGQTLRYQPAAEFSGKESITFRPGNAELQIEIEVLPRPASGFSRKDQFYAAPGGVIQLDLLANDLFSGTDFGCVEVDQPDLGVLRSLGSPGRYAYSAPAGREGIDRFTYRVKGPDCTGEADAAEVLVHIGYFEPLFDRYEMVTAAGTPLLIRNQVPVSNFVISVLEEPSFGQLQWIKDDTLLNGQVVPGKNTLLYIPDPGLASGTDRILLEYCLDGGTGCQFKKPFELMIDIRERDDEAVNYCLIDCVWPGDADRNGLVEISDLLPIGRDMGRQGAPRAGTIVDSWIAQGAADWPRDAALKHLDTNGDGLISAADTAAILAHLERTHEIIPYLPVVPESTIELVYRGGPVQAGDEVELELHLGNREQPVYDLQGFTFPLAYNPELIQPGSIRAQFDGNSWFAYQSPLLGLQADNGQGLFRAGVTRTNRRPAIGLGIIGTVRLIVTEDINGIRPGKLVFGGGMARVMDASGRSTTVRLSTVEIPFQFEGEQTVTSIEEAPESDPLRLFPNPVSDQLWVEWADPDPLRSVEVFSLDGRRVFSQNLSRSGQRFSLDLSGWVSGVYLLRFRSDRSVWQKKVQVVDRQ